MSFLDKVKKGLGSAVDGAKIASSMAVFKKDLEHAKLKKSKAIKQLGEIVYEHKDAFANELVFAELFVEIQGLDEDIVKAEQELKDEGKKFSSNDAAEPEEIKETVEEEIDALVNQEKE